MNDEPKFLAYDLETGGTDPKKNPILTGYFVVLSQDLRTIDELSIKVLPEAPFDSIDKEALKVTGIDLNSHINDPETKSRQEVSEKLIKFIEKNRPKGRAKLIRMGYNISFDDKMINSQLIPSEQWEELLHYKINDAFHIVNFLKDVGWLPQELGTLTSIVNYFNISLRTAHEAKNDVYMSIAVYERLKDLLEKQKNQSNNLTLDVLEILER